MTTHIQNGRRRKRIKIRPAPPDDPIYTGGLVIGGTPVMIQKCEPIPQDILDKGTRKPTRR